MHALSRRWGNTDNTPGFDTAEPVGIEAVIVISLMIKSLCILEYFGYTAWSSILKSVELGPACSVTTSTSDFHRPEPLTRLPKLMPYLSTSKQPQGPKASTS
ncbi:uncharacterized protein CLUP02_00833 [Colletotrichum lupini]|uniref:Uncharacterized protein n=1 Tax=Colletotrichum lupini TaxID=145971 RepID=A0A9Q8SBW6_9PEZI|nr:uncharacterized protein CLUP02_00833 [Colletotrichum lupini]UQC74185.1 hypothetical protein CLUP02_00833 [Colletotrichum lupini]